MNPLMISPLLAQANANPGPMQTVLTFLPILVLGILFWFMIIRPQKKEAQRLEVFRSKLKVGDEVITNNGLFGKITSVDAIWVTLEIARSTKVKILRQEIRMLASELAVAVGEQSPEVEKEEKESA